MNRAALVMLSVAFGTWSAGCANNNETSLADTASIPDSETQPDVSNDTATDDSTDDASTPCEPACEGLEQCIDGQCETPQMCEPGTWVCQGLTAKKVCAEDGMSFLPPQNCPGEQLCSSGQCALKCNMDPKWGSFVGCVFWTVDLPVWADPTLPQANTLPHAVVVANPNDFDAEISFTPPRA